MQSIGSRHAVHLIHFVLNEVAIDARQRLIDGLGQVFDKPGGATMKGVIAKSKKLPGCDRLECAINGHCLVADKRT